VAKVRQIFDFWYALFLFGILALLSLARVNDGSVLILSFDGDAVHMAQVVTRILGGEIPHQDFHTPLGVMAFLPIVFLMELGAGLGSAFGYAPVLIALLSLPAVHWVGLCWLFCPTHALVGTPIGRNLCSLAVEWGFWCCAR